MKLAVVKRTTTIKPPIPAPEIKAVEVRDSEIHPIDADAPVADAPDANAPASETLASAEPAGPALMPPPIVATTCLSVETDGAHWGFRNHCGYSVQYAYCLMSEGDDAASCRDGAVTGGVTPNGFGPLVADRGLMEKEARHDFRWVACQGGTGEIVPRLDRTSPPAGRCLKTGASGGG